MTPTASTTGEKPRALWATLSFIFAGCIVIAGSIAAYAVSQQVQKNNRADLLRRVETVAYLSSPTDVAALTGSDADLASAEYQRVKNSLYAISSINNDARFVYFMRATSDGSHKLMFLADSEYAGSPDYSPPGQVYAETTPYEFTQYENEASYVEGPYTDSWGTWVSAYAPVRVADGAQVATLGMDVSAQTWRVEGIAIWTGLMSVALLLAGAFLSLGVRMRRSLTLLGKSERLNAYLTEEKAYEDAVVDKARIGEWVLIPKTGLLSFNSAMYQLFGLEHGAPLNQETFLNTLTHETREAFARGLERAFETNTREYTATVVCADTDRSIHLSATIDYGSGMTPLRVTGIAQDIN